MNEGRAASHSAAAAAAPARPARPAARLRHGLLAAFLLAGGASAQERDAAPRFDFPARCAIGGDCWYVAYVDLDPGPAYRDHRCGVRSYDGHQGTDVAPADPHGAPIAVLAAAAGTVIGVRDGLDDAPLGADDDSRRGVECGNGVRVDHGGGWTSQYCHLRRGSVRVRRGAAVAAGDVLGTIGSSGLSELPHVHFQVERRGTPVDPFTGAEPASPPPCAASGASPGALWRRPERSGLGAYAPTVVYRAGMTTGRPDPVRARREGYPAAAEVTAAALVGYVVLLGAAGGTTVDTIVSGPDGAPIVERRAVVERDFARWFTFAGTRRQGDRWAPGTYRARFVVSGPAGDFITEDSARLVLR